jgi:putative pyruvate formate lyase activating enzyme
MPDSLMSNCLLCPRTCGVDRHRQVGACGSGATVQVNCSQLHFWEEPVISGSRGSGTVFFSGCNLKCVYCQNHAISQEHRGTDCSVADLAGRMLDLQGQGAHNINLVTPTHFTPLVRESLILAKDRGLAIPVVWNSSAYETVETLRSLTGLVDIYLPDFRYFDDTAAMTYSDAPRYPEFAKSAILEMFRQVGHLRTFDDLATGGLLIRILVLPGNLNRADQILAWIARELGNETCISLMGQYYPTYRAAEHPEINRPVEPAEYATLEALLEDLGFANGFVQEIGSSADYTPNFR